MVASVHPSVIKRIAKTGEKPVLTDPDFYKGLPAGLVGAPSDIFNLARDADSYFSEQAQQMTPEEKRLALAASGVGLPETDINKYFQTSTEGLPSLKDRFGTSEYIQSLLGGDPESGASTAGYISSGVVNPASALKAVIPLVATLKRGKGIPSLIENFIDNHPPVGTIDAKTGNPVTERLIKTRANAYKKELKVPAVRRREELRLQTDQAGLKSLIETAPDRKIKTPEDLLGKVLVPVVGDRTAVNPRGLESIKGVPLSQNIPLQGGPDYMIHHAGSGKAWASMEDAANKKQMGIIRAADETGQDPLGVYSTMALEGSNFSTPVATAMVAQLPALNIPKKHINAFNKIIRKGVGVSQKPVPNFVGLESPEIFDQLLGTGNFSRKGSGAIRLAVIDEMKKPRWQKLGFPIYEDVLEAVTKPDLMDLTRGDSGYGIFKGMPTKPTAPETQHLSYDTMIPGEYFGGLEKSVPPEVMFPDIFSDLSSRMTNPKKGTPRPFSYQDQVGSLMFDPSLYESYTPEKVEQLIKYMNKNLGTNYADGGLVESIELFSDN
jgi:hypothetical protein